jgi:hypothetical protein
MDAAYPLAEGERKAGRPGFTLDTRYFDVSEI